MTEELRAELEAAGYTLDQIAKEEAYLACLARQYEIVRASRECNYGFYHAEEG